MELSPVTALACILTAPPQIPLKQHLCLNSVYVPYEIRSDSAAVNKAVSVGDVTEHWLLTWCIHHKLSHIQLKRQKANSPSESLKNGAQILTDLRQPLVLLNCLNLRFERPCCWHEQKQYICINFEGAVLTFENLFLCVYDFKMLTFWF